MLMGKFHSFICHEVIMYEIMTEELVIREIRFMDDEFRGHYAT